MSWRIYSSSKSRAVRFTAATIHVPVHHPKVKQRRCHATIGHVFPAIILRPPARTILNDGAAAAGEEPTHAAGNPRRQPHHCRFSVVLFPGATPRTHYSRSHFAVRHEIGRAHV